VQSPVTIGRFRFLSINYNKRSAVSVGFRSAEADFLSQHIFNYFEIQRAAKGKRLAGLSCKSRSPIMRAVLRYTPPLDPEFEVSL
jgi:hypothetical protein